MKKITEDDIMRLLDLTYNAALKGIPGLGTAEELAEEYIKKAPTIDEAIDKLIFWQTSKCTASGAVTGLGGIITLPVAIPANISSTIYIQARMIAAIAYMRGYDIRDDTVKSLVYMCLCGNAAKDIAKQLGIKLGNKVMFNMIKKLPGKIIIEINKKVGFRLLTKFGQTGIVNLGKMIPLVGAVVGGGFDLVTTRTIGEITKLTFC